MNIIHKALRIITYKAFFDKVICFSLLGLFIFGQERSMFDCNLQS